MMYFQVSIAYQNNPAKLCTVAKSFVQLIEIQLVISCRKKYDFGRLLASAEIFPSFDHPQQYSIAENWKVMFLKIFVHLDFKRALGIQFDQTYNTNY